MTESGKMSVAEVEMMLQMLEIRHKKMLEKLKEIENSNLSPEEKLDKLAEILNPQ